MALPVTMTDIRNPKSNRLLVSTPELVMSFYAAPGQPYRLLRTDPVPYRPVLAHTVPADMFYSATADPMPDARPAKFRHLVLPTIDHMTDFCKQIRDGGAVATVTAPSSSKYTVYHDHNESAGTTRFFVNAVEESGECDSGLLRMDITKANGIVRVNEYVLGSTRDSKGRIRTRTPSLMLQWVEMISLCLVIVENVMNVDAHLTEWYRVVIMDPIRKATGDSVLQICHEKGTSFWYTCVLAFAAKCW